MGGVLCGWISYSVQHSYWSLDTNNGRAKEDLGCAQTPPPPLLLSCSAHHIEGSAALFGGGQIHLEDWPVCLSSNAPPPPNRRESGTWATYGRDKNSLIFTNKLLPHGLHRTDYIIFVVYYRKVCNSFSCLDFSKFTLSLPS